MAMNQISDPVPTGEYYVSAGLQGNRVTFTATLGDMSGDLDKAAQDVLDVMTSRPDIFTEPNVQKVYRSQAFFEPTPPEPQP